MAGARDVASSAVGKRVRQRGRRTPRPASPRTRQLHPHPKPPAHPHWTPSINYRFSTTKNFLIHHLLHICKTIIFTFVAVDSVQKSIKKIGYRSLTGGWISLIVSLKMCGDYGRSVRTFHFVWLVIRLPWSLSFDFILGRSFTEYLSHWTPTLPSYLKVTFPTRDRYITSITE